MLRIVLEDRSRIYQFLEALEIPYSFLDGEIEDSVFEKNDCILAIGPISHYFISEIPLAKPSPFKNSVCIRAPLPSTHTMDTFLAALRQAEEIVTGNYKPEPIIIFPKTEADLQSLLHKIELDNPENLSIDFEVGVDKSGEHPERDSVWKKPPLLSCSLAYKETEAIFLCFDHKESPFKGSDLPMKFLNQVLRNRSFSSHNVKFEIIVRALYHGIDIRNEMEIEYDTMLLSHYENENRPKHGLDALCEIHLPEIAGYWDEVDKYDDWYQIPLDILMPYNCMDACAHLKLQRIMLERNGGFKKLWDTLLRDAIRFLASVEIKGVKVDTRMIDKLIKEEKNFSFKMIALLQNHPLIKETMKKWNEPELEPQLIPGKITRKRKKADIIPFNPKSPHHLGRLLFEVLGLEPLRYTDKTQKTSADIDMLTHCKEGVPLLEAIYQTRQSLGTVSKFLVPLKFHTVDGRIHPSFMMHVAVTGRLSCTNPNLQNISGDPRIKGLFIAEEGCSLGENDHSQIELRVLANESRDTAMRQAFMEGKDIHKATMEQMKISERRIAKAVNFGVIFGLTANGLASDLNISREKAEQFIKRYAKVYPGIAEHRKKEIDLMRKYGYIISGFGRVRRIPKIWSQDSLERFHAENQTMNFRIQNMASDITLRGGTLCWLLGYDVFVDIVHDSLLYEAPDSEIERVGQEIAEIMENVNFPFHFDVPLKVEIKTGKRWSEMKKLGEADEEIHHK